MDLTHFDQKGNAHMVDVSEKMVTERYAAASGKIFLTKECFEAVFLGNVKKGDVLTVAQIGGIMGMKKTFELIPLCHPLNLTKCSVTFEVNREECSITAIASVKVDGKTGVEMEALTGVSMSLLTIYDMVKAIDKRMIISDIKLLEKTGGTSGSYQSNERSI